MSLLWMNDSGGVWTVGRERWKMLKLFAVINIIIDIAVILYLYFGGKIQKRKEKFWLLEKEQEEENRRIQKIVQDKADRSCVICAIQTLLAYNEKMLEQRQNTENSLIELESIKYIKDFLLDECKRSCYMKYRLRMLQS